MQHRTGAGECLAQSLVPDAAVPRPAVEVVADHRMTRRREMHAQLMRATRARLEKHQREAGSPLDHRVDRARGTPVRIDAHAATIASIGPERPVDQAAGRTRVSPDEREVELEHAPFGEVAREPGVRLVVECDEDDAARRDVETVHEARLDPLESSPLLVGERGDQSARRGVRVGAPGGERETGRLVDRREAVVEVEQSRAGRRLQWRNPKTK